ncbi:MAG: SPOR domain-containing protein [Desulfovibrio sp.]|nr:MAG: SPOR domain-containing protein [Desulfovibrio sp.]
MSKFEFSDSPPGNPRQPQQPQLLFSRTATATMLVCLALIGLLLVGLGMVAGYKLGASDHSALDRSQVPGLPQISTMEDVSGEDVSGDDASGQETRSWGGFNESPSEGGGSPEPGQDYGLDEQGGEEEYLAPPMQWQETESAGYSRTVYTVQVGAFSVRANAESMESQFTSLGYDTFIHQDDAGARTMHYVRFGQYQTRDEADAAAASFEAEQGTGAIVMVGEARVEEPSLELVPRTAFSVQVGSFQDQESARSHAEGLVEHGLSPCVIRMFGADGRVWFDVQLAQFESRAQAEDFALAFRDSEGIPSNIRGLDAQLLEERKTCLQGD